MTTKSDYKEDIERATAVFETNQGTFEAELYAKECPETVWNFINLAEGRQKTDRDGNFYDGLMEASFSSPSALPPIWTTTTPFSVR
jgi:hypothetical protein